jgi:hypothetical protein
LASPKPPDRIFAPYRGPNPEEASAAAHGCARPRPRLSSFDQGVCLPSPRTCGARRSRRPAIGTILDSGEPRAAGRSPPEPNRKLLSLHVLGVFVCDFNVCFRLPLGSVSLHRVDVSDCVDQLFRIVVRFRDSDGAATISSRGNVLAMIGRNAITARSRARPQWHLRQDRCKLDAGG